MNYSDIIALARAGFTAQQIAQMSQAEPAPAPVTQEPAPAPVPQEPAPAPVPQEPSGLAAILTEMQKIIPAASQPATAPAPQPAPAPDQLTAILAEMQTLKQTMQAQNRQNAELIPPTTQSAQDILTSIIAPPKKNGEK